MDEEKLRKSVKAGNAAQAMLSGGKLDPLPFNDAVASLRDELMKRWQSSKTSEERERIWISVNLLEKIPDTLTTIASNGRVAQQDLDRLLKRPA